MKDEERYCPREDCIYRRNLSICGQKVPACMYAAREHQSRGCSIKDCDKYTPGHRVKPRIDRASMVIEWEYEYDERRKEK